VQTKEGSAAVAEAVQCLMSTTPLPRLELSEGISSACQRHVDDIGRSGGIGHEMSDGTTLVQRVESVGEWRGNLVEILDFGSFDAREVVFNLLIDDGLPTRFHRTALLTESYNNIGIGFGSHEKYDTTVVIVLASNFD
jgi:uncharacterized protein YkwD